MNYATVSSFLLTILIINSYGEQSEKQLPKVLEKRFPFPLLPLLPPPLLLPPILAPGLTEITYPGIGHFSLTDFYDPVRRPIVLLPNTPAHINVRFWLFTRQNPASEQELKVGMHEAIKHSHFDPNRITKFIVHGYTDTMKTGWMLQMKNELLLANDFNVIIVDWSSGAVMPYTQATANTKVVGPTVANFIKELKDIKLLDLLKTHIIGHSLGSHISGMAGLEVQRRIGGLKVARITGLDPAGPYFEGLPNDAKLDSTDAFFVDAIHSDAGNNVAQLRFGMYETSGHLDFYPNGGFFQPGCQDRLSVLTQEGFAQGMGQTVSCNHLRSLFFYIESIQRDYLQSVGYQCADYNTFQNGRCILCGQDGSKCALAGEYSIEHADAFKKQTKGTRYFYNTDSKHPYIQFQYGVQIQMGHPDFGVGVAPIGIFQVTLHGTRAARRITLNKNDKIFHFGKSYNFVVTTDQDLGAILMVTFRWHVNMGLVGQKVFEKAETFIQSITTVSMSSLNIFKQAEHFKDIRTWCQSNPMEPIRPLNDVLFATHCDKGINDIKAKY